jgi:metal-responsive CopG/Arc/MetJ family transcriptional regulator
MKTGTVNISFQKELLRQIDYVAKEEARSRSELVREAARMYIERKKRWKEVFAYGQMQAQRVGLQEKDVAGEIRSYRKKQGLRKPR